MERISLLASSNDIEKAIGDMATAILADHHNSSPLFVALLRGAAPFASKLMFELTRQNPQFHPDLDYMMVSTYGNEMTAGAPRIVTDLAPDTVVDGRTVIVLDDVLDKGVTANFVFDHLRSRGALATELAVLCQKNTPRDYPITARYSALDVDDGWLIGMGMDNATTAHEAYRWHNEILLFSPGD